MKKATSDPREKVLFYFDTDNGTEVESMWAVRKSEELYEIDNIPFYAKSVALGDVVRVERDPDGALVFRELVTASGHSTVHVLFSDEKDVQPVRAELRVLGCPSEISDLPVLISVDVPSSVDYAKVKAFLERGERAALFEYQEACLGFV